MAECDTLPVMRQCHVHLSESVERWHALHAKHATQFRDAGSLTYLHLLTNILHLKPKGLEERAHVGGLTQGRQGQPHRLERRDAFGRGLPPVVAEEARPRHLCADADAAHVTGDAPRHRARLLPAPCLGLGLGVKGYGEVTG